MAMRTDGDSNHAFISHVKIYGYQDTLLVDRGTHYFDSCTIAGNVDFIYGSGQAVFNHCEIISRGSGGYITAASTLSDHYGFLIINSKLEKESPKMADGSVSLGRPWHNNPNVVYINTFMDSHISSAGWTSMGSLTPNDARYFEYGSTGPGAMKSNTRKMLTDDQVQEYTIANFLGGWNPAQPAKNAKISVYIAGDDTASGAKSASGIGWGKAFPTLFDNRVTVHNEAIPGSSSKSYMDQNGLNKLAGELKNNDVLLIQFGQNDGNKNDPKTYADWMINYKANLKRFIGTAQKRGAVPVLITPVKFDANGKLAAMHNDYTNSMVELAKIIGVSYIDLSSDTGPVGADEMAKRIALGIQKDQLQLSYFVKEKSGNSP
jgi:lysophospholipase L1-like esterase